LPAYPVRQMSDTQSCEKDATARGVEQLNKMVAAAAKK
jgi:hypothetical protein